MPNTWSDFFQRSGNSELEPDLRKQLDGLAKIAAQLFAAPCAQINLAIPTARIFVGSAGPGLGLTDNGQVFLGLVADSRCGLVVPDAHNDPRFMRRPGANDASDPRFFAGVPLRGRTGLAVGALCVIDTAARGPPPVEKLEDLRTLAKAALACLDRWRMGQIETGLPARSPPAGHGRRFETLADALPQLVWSARCDGGSDYFSRQWCQFTGAPPGAGFGTGWLDFIHPEDVPIASTAWANAVKTAEPYTTEFRLRKADGTFRWMLARGLPVIDAFGRVTRWIGTCTDIDERVRTGDRMEFMSRELSHRIKNLFAVVQGLISMALRKHPGMDQVNQSLQTRIVALGRAHDLIRPRLVDCAMLMSQTTLHKLIEIVTLPFVQDNPSRLQIVGDDAVVDERAATPLALFFHEMAMNSARFGALGAPQGRLRIAIAVNGDVSVDWLETGGPQIDQAPRPAFGLGLTRLTIERQLAGVLTMTWQRNGLHALARVPSHQLAAAPMNAG
jgi:PAS domain S-box-containing protein